MLSFHEIFKHGPKENGHWLAVHEYPRFLWHGYYHSLGDWHGRDDAD